MSTAYSMTPISPRVAKFIGEPRLMLIGGGWVSAASGVTRDVFNPAI